MQHSQLVLGGLLIGPVVDWPRPLMKRILGAPAAWADIPDFTIEPRGLAGASKIILACWQIQVLIVLVDLREVILGRLQLILSWLLMSYRSLHRSIARLSSGVLLRFGSVQKCHRRRQHNHSSEKRAHDPAPLG